VSPSLHHPKKDVYNARINFKSRRYERRLLRAKFSISPRQSGRGSRNSQLLITTLRPLESLSSSVHQRLAQRSELRGRGPRVRYSGQSDGVMGPAFQRIQSLQSSQSYVAIWRTIQCRNLESRFKDIPIKKGMRAPSRAAIFVYVSACTNREPTNPRLHTGELPRKRQICEKIQRTGFGVETSEPGIFNPRYIFLHLRWFALRVQEQANQLFQHTIGRRIQ